MGTFQISKRPNGEFAFNLRATNGQVILSSEGYQTKGNALSAIESVKRNGQIRDNFRLEKTVTGSYYFILHAPNQQIIGTSQIYAALASAEAGVHAVMKNVTPATIVDEPVVQNNDTAHLLTIADFIKDKRKLLGLSQSDLALKAGVGLRFVRELESGEKNTLRIDKVNQVLALFGHRLGPVPIK